MSLKKCLMTKFTTVEEFQQWQIRYANNYVENLKRSANMIQDSRTTYYDTIVCGTQTIGGDFSRGSSPVGGFSSSRGGSSGSISSSSSLCCSTGATISSLFGR